MFVPVTENPKPQDVVKYPSPDERPNRTWEPLLQEHENEADIMHEQRKQHVAAAQADTRQGQLFTDRRK
jgi:hypothetical protein